VAAREPNGAPPREKPQRVADEVRALIVSGELSEGDSLGQESQLVERFGVSRPSLREALRILETQGLVTVKRGVSGGVIAHQPDGRLTARTAAMVLQSRQVSLADVYQARSLLEPLAARAIAASPDRRGAVAELKALVDAEEGLVGDAAAFGEANVGFHERLVSLGGNQTLAIVTEMLAEVVARAVRAMSTADDVGGSLATRRRSIRSQRRLVELLDAGDAEAAEAHWRNHMAAVGRIMLGPDAASVVDLGHHAD
jgi:GntR family transcriptional repressor for pyruvate dehydrogenase complex